MIQFLSKELSDRFPACHLSYKIIQGDSLLEKLFGQVIQLDTIGYDPVTNQLIESIQATRPHFCEGNTNEKRQLEIKILSKQAELSGRLLEAKKEYRNTYQTKDFGDRWMSARDQKAKDEYDVESNLLDNLMLKAKNAKNEITRLALNPKD